MASGRSGSAPATYRSGRSSSSARKSSAAALRISARRAVLPYQPHSNRSAFCSIIRSPSSSAVRTRAASSSRPMA
ncbi:hypothetical protein BJF90_05625 [Pseudonocardia sp. CNS-004]|nr:hypothetical protein BJF90_05625 [Pseudonocardia sp. CNS-004]